MTEKTITRAHLSNAVYQNMKVSLGEATTYVDVFFDEISEVLSQDEAVKLSSFGTFNLRYKKSRVGRNPKTGVEVPITPRTVLSFNPSNLLKKRVNDTLSQKK